MILMQSRVGRAPLFDTWANWCPRRAPELDIKTPWLEWWNLGLKSWHQDSHPSAVHPAS